MKFIFVNIASVVMMGILAVTYVLLGTPTWFLPCFVICTMLCGILNYRVLVTDKDVIANLRSADKKRLFHPQVTRIESAVKTVEFYKAIFGKFEEGTKLRATYDMLMQVAYGNVEKATVWMAHYDYNSRPSTAYLDGLAESSQQVVQKLNELDELLLKVDDSATSVDISGIDDMLDSLKEMVSEDE